MIRSREFDSVRSRSFTLPADGRVIHLSFSRRSLFLRAKKNRSMTAFLTLKIATLIGIISLLVGSAVGDSANAAQPSVILQQPYFWKHSTPEWKPPTADFPLYYAADYVAPQSAYGEGHRGIDFRSAIGRVVRSPLTGQVIEARVVGYRSVITVRDANGNLATMEPVCAAVNLGAAVYGGQVIAKTCTPQPQYVWHCELCVHLSARVNGQYLSPLLLMGMFEPSVLKPFVS